MLLYFTPYSETCLQGTPQYPRKCPYMTGVPSYRFFNMEKIGNRFEKTSTDQRLYCMIKNPKIEGSEHLSLK